MPTATHGSSSDADLMRSVQANDAAAFGALYDRHAALAWRIARGVCHDAGRAEDAVQEGFLSACAEPGGLLRRQGPVKGRLMAIVRNRAIDLRRREAATHRPRLAGHDYDGPAPGGASLQDKVISRMEADALRITLRELPDAQAEVIALAYYGELTHSEIALTLSLPQGTVKGRTRLGLTKLRSQLELG